MFAHSTATLLCSPPLQMNGFGEKSNGGTAENFPSQGFHASLTFNYFITSQIIVLAIFIDWFECALRPSLLLYMGARGEALWSHDAAIFLPTRRGGQGGSGGAYAYSRRKTGRYLAPNSVQVILLLPNPSPPFTLYIRVHSPNYSSAAN